MEHDPAERPLYEQRERAPHDPAQDERGGEIEGSGMIRADTERPPDLQEAEQELPAAPQAGRRSSSRKATGARRARARRR